MQQDTAPVFAGTRALWLGLAVMAGVALALSIAPAVFRTLPSDMTRISVLLDVIKNPDVRRPTMMVFGNSVAMTSVDAESISERLPGSPLIYNFASTGQSPLESYLYFQHLDRQTRVVILMFGLQTIASAEVLDPQKYNAFYMYGYRPDSRTRSQLAALLGDDMERLLDKSPWQHRFESRWIVRQTVDSLARDIFRDDLQLDRATYDLFFPATGAKRLPERLFARDVDIRYPLRTGIYRPEQGKLDLLAEMAARIREQESQLILVLMPQHPAMCERRTPAYCDQARETFSQFSAQHNVPVLDGTRIVPEPLFADSVHPTIEGASVFSDWLTVELLTLIQTGRISF